MATTRADRFKIMWLRGCPLSSISKILRFNSIQVASNYRRRMGLGSRMLGRDWSGRHGGTWTDEEKELVNYMFDEGITPEDISHAVGTRKAAAIRFVLRNKSEGFSDARNRKHTVYRNSSHRARSRHSA